MFKRILLIIFCFLSVILILVGCAIRPFAFSGLLEGDGLPTDNNGLINNVVFYDYSSQDEFIVVNGDGMNYKPDDQSLETPYIQFFADDTGEVLFSYKAINHPNIPSRNQFVFSDFNRSQNFYNTCLVNFNSFKASDYNSLIVKASSHRGSQSRLYSSTKVTFNVRFNLTEYYLDRDERYIVTNRQVVIPVVHNTDFIDSPNGYSVLRTGLYRFNNGVGISDLNAVHFPSFDDLYFYIQSEWTMQPNTVYEFSSECYIDDLTLEIWNGVFESSLFVFDNVTIDYDINNSATHGFTNSTLTLDSERVNVNIFQWIGDAVQGFLDITIFGNITFGHLILIVIAIPVLIGILKMIAGG